MRALWKATSVSLLLDAHRKGPSRKWNPEAQKEVQVADDYSDTEVIESLAREGMSGFPGRKVQALEGKMELEEEWPEMGRKPRPEPGEGPRRREFMDTGGETQCPSSAHGSAR